MDGPPKVPTKAMMDAAIKLADELGALTDQEAMSVPVWYWTAMYEAYEKENNNGRS